MRPSLGSGLWIVAGIGTIATCIALLVGLITELGVVSGGIASGRSFDMVLVIEIALVAAIVLILIGATRQARRQ
jgi:hypothetical protein